MANVAEKLTAEIIDIPGCPGFGILLGGVRKNHAYARELARCATIQSGHPWVSPERTDAAMLAAIKSDWATSKPGWLNGSTDAQIVEMHAHSAISHHLPRGCELLTPDAVAAVRLLAGRPELAARSILAYRGYDSIAQCHTVLDLVLTEGSQMPARTRVLDVDAFDNDVERYDSVSVPGKSVITALLAGEVHEDA